MSRLSLVISSLLPTSFNGAKPSRLVIGAKPFLYHTLSSSLFCAVDCHENANKVLKEKYIMFPIIFAQGGYLTEKLSLIYPSFLYAPWLSVRFMNDGD